MLIENENSFVNFIYFSFQRNVDSLGVAIQYNLTCIALLYGTVHDELIQNGKLVL